MTVKRIASAAAVFASALAGCSGSGSNPAPVTSVNVLQGKLQLAVGTANIFGDLGGAANGSATGLNVVTTFRQVQGQQTVGASETLVNTPSLSGPFTLPGGLAAVADNYGATLTAGPTASEVTANAITATAQPPAGTYPVNATSFGVFDSAVSVAIGKAYRRPSTTWKADRSA